MKTLYFKNGVLVRSSWTDSDFLYLLSVHTSDWLIQQINDNGTIRNSAKGEMVENKVEVIEVQNDVEIMNNKGALNDVELCRQYASRRANGHTKDGIKTYNHNAFERAFLNRLRYFGYSRYENAIDATVTAILERSKAKYDKKHG